MEPLVAEELVLLAERDGPLPDVQARRLVCGIRVREELAVPELVRARARPDVDLGLQVVGPVPARARAAVKDLVEPVVEVVFRLCLGSVLPAHDAMGVRAGDSRQRRRRLGLRQNRREEECLHAPEGAEESESGSPGGRYAARALSHGSWLSARQTIHRTSS